LFAIGLFLNNGEDFFHWRIMGVLQRFAFSYLFTGIILLVIPSLFSKVNSYDLETEPLIEDKTFSRIPNRPTVLPFLLQWIAALIVVFAYVLITFWMPVLGCPTGYLGPGGISDEGRYFNCT